MTQVFSPQSGHPSDTSELIVKPYLRPWIFGMVVILASWIGASVLLDIVIMPEMATAGIMTSQDFIPAGFSLFQHFNSLELLTGSLLLASGLYLVAQEQICHTSRLVMAAIALFVIPMIYFYQLGPQMAGLGFALDGNFTQTLTATMDTMHTAYWGLDCLKLVCAGVYLNELWILLNQPSQSQ